MKKIFLLVLGVVISFSVYAEGEIKVYKLTKIESSTDSDQDDLKKGIFIIKDTADKHCYLQRYKNGVKDRCYALEGEFLTYNHVFGLRKNALTEENGKLTIDAMDGFIMIYSYMPALTKDNAIIESKNNQMAKEKGLEKRKKENEEEEKEKQSKDAFQKKIDSNSISVKKLNLDGKKYLNKNFTIYGYLKPEYYYNFSYRDASATHYSTLLKDDLSSSFIVVYWNKGKFPDLIDRLNDKKYIRVKVRMISLSSRYEEATYGSNIMYEGMELEVIDK